MLMYAKAINPDRPIEDHVAEAKNYLRRAYEGDLIDWATLDYRTEVQSIEGSDVTIFTLTVESAGSMAVTFKEEQ